MKNANQIFLKALRMSFFFLNYQFFRFLFVGIFNTGFSYLVYVIGVLLGLHFALANLVALLLGIIFSFYTQGRFVFKNTNIYLLWRFILSWAFIYLISIAAIGGWILLGIDQYTAGALAIPISTGLSYLLQKKFVFPLQIQNEAEKISTSTE